MAARVPLVRVEGKTYHLRADLTLTPQRFAAAAELDREARDEIAREAEAAYDLGACLYFYAGYACPEFGDVVLVYHPEHSSTVAGNASSFDTGGMLKAYIKGAGLDSSAARKAHVCDDLCNLPEWRARLENWISEYFASSMAYLDGSKPVKDDPSGRLHHDGNDRRAWTYEVRLHENHGLFDELAFAMVRQDFLHGALAAAAASTVDYDRLLALLDDRRLRARDAGDAHGLCALAQNDIVQYALTPTGGAL